MIATRFALPKFVCLVVATVSVAQSPASDEAPQTIAVGQLKDLRIDLKVAHKASLSARDWIALEFRNLGTNPLVMKNANYRIESERDNLKTGQLVCSGGLASGNSADLFPRVFGRRPPRVETLEASPSVYRIGEHLSDYSASLLGLPSRDGLRVRARFFLNVQLNDGRRLDTPVSGVPFTFDWVYPDEAGFKTLRDRLIKLLANPEQKAVHDYLLKTLLDIPEVARAAGRGDILAGLERRQGGSDGRPAIADALAKRYAHDPVILAYYRDRLEAPDERVLADLLPAGGLWDKSFVNRLVRLYESDPLKFNLALRVLHQHRSEWVKDGQTPGRLSAVVRRECPLLNQKLGELKATNANGKLERMDLLARWTRGVSALAMTGDRSVIPLLRPALQDRYAIDSSNRIAFGGKRMPPLRVCDWALEAILVLLDGSPDEAYRQAMVGKRDIWARPGDDAAWAIIRNEMIESLEKRLSALDAANK